MALGSQVLSQLLLMVVVKILSKDGPPLIALGLCKVVTLRSSRGNGYRFRYLGRNTGQRW